MTTRESPSYSLVEQVSIGPIKYKVRKSLSGARQSFFSSIVPPKLKIIFGNKIFNNLNTLSSGGVVICTEFYYQKFGKAELAR